MTKTDLKRKTVNGFFWGFIESVLSQGQGLIFGIFLLRLLSPDEFGLLAYIVIFISIAQVFVDSGLSQALIRKQTCTNRDYSTVFWTNISLGIFFYLLMWVAAPFVAAFFNNYALIELTRVSGLTILVGSLTLIQQTILTKEVDFKTMAKISTVSTFIAGVVSVGMALTGFGVWSLVWRPIINQVVRSFWLWVHNRWRPQFLFDKTSFKELFAFSSNILFISIIAAAFRNIYYVVIGKSYTSAILGNYNQADNYSQMPSSTLGAVTNKVSYPILSGLQDNDIKLKDGCKKLVHNIMYLSFFVMFGLAAVAKPLFLVAFGDTWVSAVVFFQVLCIAYSISPMHIINHNIMKVKGRSDLFFRTEIIKYIIFVPIILAGIAYGINALILGIVLFYWISFLINAMYSRKLIGYSIMKQSVDLIPVFLICLLPAALSWSLGILFPLPNLILLFVQGTVYVLLVLSVSIVLKLPAYLEMKEIIFRKLGYISFINNFIQKI